MLRLPPVPGCIALRIVVLRHSLPSPPSSPTPPAESVPGADRRTFRARVSSLSVRLATPSHLTLASVCPRLSLSHPSPPPSLRWLLAGALVPATLRVDRPAATLAELTAAEPGVRSLCF
eukprot:605308-Rhodomonas_salina.3